MRGPSVSQMTTSMAYMGASDAFSWYMERDPALRSTVVVVDWLDRAPDWDVLVDRIDRISRLMPSLRQRVVETPVPPHRAPVEPTIRISTCTGT